MPLGDRLEQVRGRVRGLGSALVAFSGGADSALVLALAHQALGENAVALTGVSASLPSQELAAARAFALALGVRHEVVETRELEDPDYAKNPVDRCYHCKKTLYAVSRETAAKLGLFHVLDGFNADDARDYRPGRRAAVEAKVVSPLADAGFTKADVREAARELGLAVWDKPATPCLSSRLPYGTAVTPERLAMVGAAEAALHALGFGELRVRHHGDLARVELTEVGLARLADGALRARVDGAVKAAGYRFVAVDLEPFRSGRLNDALVSLPQLVS